MLPLTGITVVALEQAVAALYGPFRVGDGASIYLAIQNEREWARLCADVLQQPELTGDPRFRSNPDRVAHRQALQQIIEQAFDSLSGEEVLARLETAQIASARLNSLQEF